MELGQLGGRPAVEAQAGQLLPLKDRLAPRRDLRDPGHRPPRGQVHLYNILRRLAGEQLQPLGALPVQIARQLPVPEHPVSGLQKNRLPLRLLRAGRPQGGQIGAPLLQQAGEHLPRRPGDPRRPHLAVRLEGGQAAVHPGLAAGLDGRLGGPAPDQPHLGPQPQLHVPGEVVQHRLHPLQGGLFPQEKLVHIAVKHIAVAQPLHGQAGGAEGLPPGGEDQGRLALPLEAGGPLPGGHGDPHLSRLLLRVHPHGAQKGHVPHLPGVGQGGLSAPGQKQRRRQNRRRSHSLHRWFLRFKVCLAPSRHFIRGRGGRSRLGCPRTSPAPLVKGAR